MRLFGTDGVRGTAGQYPLDIETIRRLGAALVRAVPNRSDAHRFVIGRDTRESGAWIERELAYGARGAGAAAVSAGVIPTPAIAFLTRAHGFDAGIMISASHNPFQDNGIKVFSGAGEKFTDRLEREVEATVADHSWSVPPGDAAPVPFQDFSPAYLAHVRQVLPDAGRCRGLDLVVDCANGAMTDLAPRLLRDLGFSVETIGAEPDGRNINLRCGSTAPARLVQTVLEGTRKFGVAFDGDGDRAIFVDHRGRVIDGDGVLLIAARQLQSEGRLRGSTVVATVMSNLGLEIALRRLGIGLVRCPVGDKHVMETMLARDLSLGGEQSGHVIFADYLYTGDGLITALNVLRTMEATGRDLADLADGLETFPQILLNVRVREKRKLEDIPAISATIAEVEGRLGDSGRLLVRYSGTEPVLRIMLEGQHENEIRAWGEEIAQVVREHLC